MKRWHSSRDVEAEAGSSRVLHEVVQQKRMYTGSDHAQLELGTVNAQVTGGGLLGTQL